jgi:hypothetical protein
MDNQAIPIEVATFLIEQAAIGPIERKVEEAKESR